MIAILGGGITALSAAHELKKQGKEFILLEKESFLGGKIQTVQQDGFTFELGPNTVVINNKETKELLDDLKLYDKRIEPEEKAINNRFVLKNGKMEHFPNTFSKAIASKLFSWSTLINILKEPFKKSANIEEESLADFTRRRFSNQILQDFITPFVTGIYAGDPEKMSVNHTMSMLKDAENNHGSVIKGMMKFMKEKKKERDEYGLPKQKIFSFQNGLKELIDAIAKSISESVVLDSKVVEINSKESRFHIKYLEEGKEKNIEVDSIISTIPASALSKIEGNIHEGLGDTLEGVNYVAAGVLHLAFKKIDIEIGDSFGLLSRKEENVPFLGVLFNSSFFPHQSKKDSHLLTIIYGGERKKELLECSDEELKMKMIDSLKKILNIKGEAILFHRKDWKKAIPQYNLGYGKVIDAVQKIENSNPNFYIGGNYYKGVSVSDCIANGKSLAQKTI